MKGRHLDVIEDFYEYRVSYAFVFNCVISTSVVEHRSSRINSFFREIRGQWVAMMVL